MILDVGKPFVPPRSIVEFMRKCGYHSITTKHEKNMMMKMVMRKMKP